MSHFGDCFLGILDSSPTTDDKAAFLSESIPDIANIEFEIRTPAAVLSILVEYCITQHGDAMRCGAEESCIEEREGENSRRIGMVQESRFTQKNKSTCAQRLNVTPNTAEMELAG